MKSILLTLMLTFVSLYANTDRDSQNTLMYSINLAENFKPFVSYENKLENLKIDILDLTIGVSGEINKSVSYTFKYCSSQKLYTEIKSFYDKLLDVKVKDIETSILYVNLNLKF